MSLVVARVGRSTQGLLRQTLKFWGHLYAFLAWPVIDFRFHPNFSDTPATSVENLVVIFLISLLLLGWHWPAVDVVAKLGFVPLYLK